MTSTKRYLWRELVDAGRMISAMASPASSRVRKFYETYSRDNLTTEKSSYMNMGYWKSGTESMDEAGQALAGLLADAAGFASGDRVLDVGFGYGDQDFYWLDRYDVKRIEGLNVTPFHVRYAQQRAEREGVADRLHFQICSATALNFPAESFDRVTALECSFHFYTRQDFFRQAFRALRPGGVIATADILPLPQDRTKQSGPNGGMHAGMIPKENWYPADTYADRLRACGFTDVRINSIRDDVWDGWRKHIRRTIDDPAFKERASRLYYRLLRRGMANQDGVIKSLSTLDYVIASARKPDAS